MVVSTERRRITWTVRRSQAICSILHFRTLAIFAALQGPTPARLFDSGFVWRTTANLAGTIASGYVSATVILSDLVCLVTADLEAATFNSINPIRRRQDRIHHLTKKQCA